MCWNNGSTRVSIDEFPVPVGRLVFLNQNIPLQPTTSLEASIDEIGSI